MKKGTVAKGQMHCEKNDKSEEKPQGLCSNAQEVWVVKYIVVYGQIKATDQKYRQTIFGRDIVEQWSRI